MDKICLEKFEEFWKTYPARNGKKLGKQITYDMFKRKKLHNGNFAELIKATKNYADSSLSQRGYAKDPVRFLRHEDWWDWLEPETSHEELAKKEADRERLKRELKQAYQDRQAAQEFLDACEPDDSRYHGLLERVKTQTRKIDILEEKLC